MRNLLVRLSLTVAALAGAARASEAQETQEAQSTNQRAFGLGLGVGAARMTVGDQRTSTTTASISGRFGIDARNRLLLVAEWNTAEVDNPVMDESFSAVNALLAFTFGRTFKVRPGLGIQFRSWSGTEQVTPSDATLLFGLDAGLELPLGPRLSLAPELVLRYSQIELEGNVSSRFIGVQLVASYRLAGH